MRSGYHPTHKRNGDKETLKEQGFYHKTAWRRLRLMALQRDHYLCQECLKKHKFTVATEVHHIVALEDCPSLGLELSNLVSLCWDCHEATKHVKDRSAEQRSPAGVRVIRVSDGSEMEKWKNAE